MKKLLSLVATAFVLSSSICFAENYYVISEYQLLSHKDKDGNTAAIQCLTKISDEIACKKATEQKKQPIGEWKCLGGANCIKGSELFVSTTSRGAGGPPAETFSADFVFSHLTKDGSGVTFTDHNGFQTKCSLTFLTGPESPRPGSSGKFPSESFPYIIENLVRNLEGSGAADVKIIYPENTTEVKK